MPLTAEERETVVNFNDAEEVAYIYTAQRTLITRLKKNRAATLIEEGRHDGSQWARFELPAALVSFRAVKTKRTATPAQIASLAEAREKRMARLDSAP
jgi:hypothetical protein